MAIFILSKISCFVPQAQNRVGSPFLQIDLRFVGMDNGPMNQFFQYPDIRDPIILCCIGLEPIQLPKRNGQAKIVFGGALQILERDAIGDILINGPGHEAMAKASLVPPGLRHEGAVAILAPMEGREIADNPSLDATGGDAEV